MAHPPRDDIPGAVLERARKICLGLPEATEKRAWGHPTFRIRDTMFATIGAFEDPDIPSPSADPLRVVMTMKCPPGEQDLLVDRGHPFFFPKYVGVRGWIGVVVDGDTDWDEIEELVEDSYREIAPARLVRVLEEER